MPDPEKAAREKLASLLAEACSQEGYTVDARRILAGLETPREQFGDVASPIAFELAKAEKRPPRRIAEELLAAIPADPLVEKVEVAGAGYLNFHYSTPVLAAMVLGEIRKNAERYGSVDVGKGRKALVEFPSVNPNKPWHIGHLRNALLGDSVARVLEFAGFRVEREDYIDDLGLQVAQSLWGYMNLGGEVKGKLDHWLGEQYVEVAKRFEEPSVNAQVREIMKALERGEGDIAKLGRELSLKCVLAQYETAFRLGIFHDVLVWESDIVRTRMSEAALKEAVEKGAAEKETAGKNAGCIVARLERLEEFAGMESADKVLVRGDGTMTYTGKDLAFQMWKFGLIPSNFKFRKLMEQPDGKPLYSTDRQGSAMPFGKADVVINVIGSEQSYPQKVLRSMLRLMGYEEQAKNSVHLAYEHAELPEGRMSGRKGTWVGFTADEVVEETVKEAMKQIRERFPDMGEEEKKKIAEVVGIGALKFDLLKTTPEKKIIFRWEEALRFEGDTAPYIQYSHARAARILEKAGGAPGEVVYSAITTPDEKRLVKMLARFPGAVEQAALHYRPHIIAEYLLALSDSFSKFYQNCPVLQAEEPVRSARLTLVKSYKTVVKSALRLLGIEAPERM